MADSNILSDFGIKILEQEIDDVIFQTNEFLCDATFTGSPRSILVDIADVYGSGCAVLDSRSWQYGLQDDGKARANRHHEAVQASCGQCDPLLVVPPADTGITNNGSSWCVLDFLSYIPNCIGSYTHDLYEAESAQIEDKFEEVQELIYTRDTLYNSLQAQADVAHSGTSDPNLIESTMEQAGVDEVTNMETDASKLWFTSLTAGAVVGIDKVIMLIALIVFRIGWWATIYCQQILLGMLTIFGPIQWAFSLLPKWE